MQLGMGLVPLVFSIIFCAAILAADGVRIGHMLHFLGNLLP